MTINFVPETFEPHIGSIFAAQVADTAVRLELMEVKHGVSTPTMSQFSLFLKGPAEPLLQQQIVHLSHAALGEMDLFVVPVAREGECVVYEVAFASMIEKAAPGA